MNLNPLFYRYWEYGYHHSIDSFYLVPGARNISDYGLPPELHNMDAAFVWSGNGRTYFFKGGKYWGYRRRGGGIDSGYPKRISVWRGIPNDIDAAFKWQGNGRTYFFKGKDYYRFNDRYHRAGYGYPKRIALGWFNCSAEAANLAMMVESQQRSTSISIDIKTDSKLSKTTMFRPDLQIVLFMAFATGHLMI